MTARGAPGGLLSGLAQSLTDAFRGLALVLATERNIRIHAWAAFSALGAARVLPVEIPQVIWVLSAVALVVLAEMLNTAIEAMVDLVSPGRSGAAGRAKQIAAAAVLAAVGYALWVAVVVFGPRLAELPAAMARAAALFPWRFWPGFLGWAAIGAAIFLPRRKVSDP